MPQPPHHPEHPSTPRPVNPWRKRAGMIVLGVASVALCAMLWNHRVAADMIRSAVDQWNTGDAPEPDVEERYGKEVVVGGSDAGATSTSDAGGTD